VTSSELSSQIYNAALALLARREHSQQELRQKLLKRFSDSETLVQETLARLEGEGYQSDLRYIEAYIRSRLNKGYGAQRLRQELRLRGLAADLTDSALAELKDGEQHLEQLIQVWRKKFKILPKDSKEKFRQINFLRYRGFSAADIEALFRYLQQEE
jgi:Uncharacterized protein conserved in bacteria